MGLASGFFLLAATGLIDFRWEGIAIQRLWLAVCLWESVCVLLFAYIRQRLLFTMWPVAHTYGPLAPGCPALGLKYTVLERQLEENWQAILDAPEEYIAECARWQAHLHYNATLKKRVCQLKPRITEDNTSDEEETDQLNEETDQRQLDAFDADFKHFGPFLDVSRQERYDNAVRRYQQAVQHWVRTREGPQPVPPPDAIVAVLRRRPEEARFVPRDNHPKNHPRDPDELAHYYDWRANRSVSKRPFRSPCRRAVQPYRVTSQSWRSSQDPKKRTKTQRSTSVLRGDEPTGACNGMHVWYAPTYGPNPTGTVAGTPEDGMVVVTPLTDADTEQAVTL